jgi:hypothetical protein
MPVPFGWSAKAAFVSGDLSARFSRKVGNVLRRFRLMVTLAGSFLFLADSAAADPLDAGFAAAQPLFARYCLDCHSGDKPEGDVDLAALGDLDAFRRHPKLVQRVRELVARGQMPPPEAEQPNENERKTLRSWLEAFLAAEARSHAGDPGRVVLRRLNNAEYKHTVRDLTGVGSLDPSREFPADGGAGEGFTNTGQSLAMSPILVTKYLDAAKELASHAVLLPDSLAFSAGDSRRDFADEWLARLRRFYARYSRPLDAAEAAAHQTVQQGIPLDTGHEGFLPIEKYLLATLAERDRLAKGPDAVIAVARERGLSPKYLATLFTALSTPAADAAENAATAGRPSPILDTLRARWKSAQPADAPALAAFVSQWQNVLWKFNAASQIVSRFGPTGGPPSWMEAVTPLVEEQDIRVKLAVPKDKDTVTIRLVAGDAGDGHEDDVVVLKNPRLVAPGRADLPLATVRPIVVTLDNEHAQLLAGVKPSAEKVTGPVAGGDEGSAGGLDHSIFGRHPQGLKVEPTDMCLQAPGEMAVTIPADLAEGVEFVTVAAMHPQSPAEASVQFAAQADAAAVVATGGLVPSLPVVARKDSAAWRRYETTFAAIRDLFPKAVCYGRIVPVDGVVTLNLYYREDDQLRRLMLDDAECKELDRLWDELLFIAREPLEFEDVYEQFNEYAAQVTSDEVEPLTSIKPTVAACAEAFRKRLVEGEPRHLDAVIGVAGRAFRRPLVPAEESRLRTLYDTLRKKAVPHEEAICAVLAHVLVAPDFLYKIETAGPGKDAKPVSDYELATRLSYFLWSSMPDADLIAAAESGRLHDPEVLKSQTRRMLAAPASRRLAEEFGTQWLHVYGFSSLDEKNAELFPTFADLRADMEEETVLFLEDFLRNDRSILSLVDADHTFLNERLAKHYGIEGVTGDEWRRVEGVRKHGRGSILCLATTLATQAGASRTSPILRGNWLYENILGEKLPKPPKNIPPLAETLPAGLSERQLIALHTQDAACAKCHRLIDHFGFALEEFDAIGRHRTTDAAGRPLDTLAALPEGGTIDGQQGLRNYLLGPQRDQFVRVFCRKVLGYALGRGVQLSDEPLLDEMVARLAAADYRVSVAIDAIVMSPQFRSIRGRDAADDGA